MDVPASLRHRIELFRETARVFRMPNELFAENSWIQVMLGQGIEPKHYHPVADLMEDPELRRFLETIRMQVERTVSGLPPHGDYLRQYCPAQPPA
jgi:tryptophan halogenase